MRACAVAGLLLLASTPNLFGESPPSDQVLKIQGDKGDCTVSQKYGAGDFDRDMLRVGSGGDDLVGHAPLFFFALPKLPSRDALLGAELELHYMGLASASGPPPTYDADLFGLGTRATPTGSGEDYPNGSSPAPLLVRSLLNSKSPLGRTRVSDARFREYVAGLYNTDGTPTAAYAVFRVSTDAKFPPANRRYQGYELASANKANGAVTYTPQLTLTFQPSATVATNSPTPPAINPSSSSAEGSYLRPVIWLLAILLVLCVVMIVSLVLLLLHVRGQLRTATALLIFLFTRTQNHLKFPAQNKLPLDPCGPQPPPIALT